jgi:hypothetical protein
MLAAVVMVSGSALAGTAVWTGLGSDDRWANPDNWQDGILPTLEDQVVFDGFPSEEWATRNLSVTIDTPAWADSITLWHYGQQDKPFQQIYITAGGDLVTNYEAIDQCSYSNVGSGRLEQTGGAHTVNGSSWYTTYGGDFVMTGGEWNVAGQITLNPEEGSVSITGGSITAATLHLGGSFWSDRYEIGGTASITVSEELRLPSFSQFLATWDFWMEEPIEMRSADFVISGEITYYNRGLETLDLLFDGGLDDVSLFEVAGLDYGAVPIGWDENFAIGDLWIGGSGTGYVQLVDNYGQQPSGPGADDAVYVDRLVISGGSVLDLNGYQLYCKQLVDEGGVFLNGEPVVVPEPGMILLLGLGAVMARRKG